MIPQYLVRPPTARRASAHRDAVAYHNMTESHPPRSLPRSRFAQELARFPGTILTPEPISQYASHWPNLFRQRMGATFDGRITLEIGCFDAEFLCRAAVQHPTRAFIGVDWKARAIVTGAQRIEQLNLPNILLMRQRGQEIARLFSPRQLHQIWILHPDPFAAENEIAQRLVSPQFLIDAHQMLASAESRLVLKTDHAEYARSTLALLDQPTIATLWKCRTHSADFWNDPIARAAAESAGYSGHPTRFERRFLQKNLPIHLIELSPHSATSGADILVCPEKPSQE